MGKTTEQAKVDVFLNGQQAADEMNQLTSAANKYKKAMADALAAGDTKKYNQAEKGLKGINSQMRQLSKEAFDVTKVLDNLSGASLSDLYKAQRKLNAELRKPTLKRYSDEWKVLTKSLSSVNGEINKVRTEMGSIQTPGQKVIATLKGWLPALGVGVLVSGLKQIGTEIFNVTKQIQGENIRNVTVLGDQLGYVEEQADKLSKKMGVTNHQFVTMVTATADLLVPLDFSRKKAAEMATQVQSLSGALDEWTAGKYGVAEVSDILNKAMLGEMEQLKGLGIAIRQDSQEFTGLVKMYEQTTNMTNAQARAQATLDLIYKKSGDAQRAYMQDGNKLLRMQKSVTRWFQQMKEKAASWLDESQVEKLQRQRAELNTLVTAITGVNNTEETRKKLIDELQRKYPDFLKNLNTEKLTNEQLRVALKGANEEYDNKILLAAKEEKLKDTYSKMVDLKLKELKTIKDIARLQNKMSEQEAEQNKYPKMSAQWLEAGKEVTKTSLAIDNYNDTLESTRNKTSELVKEQQDLNNAVSELMTTMKGGGGSGTGGGTGTGIDSTSPTDTGTQSNVMSDGTLEFPAYMQIELQNYQSLIEQKKEAAKDWENFNAGVNANIDAQNEQFAKDQERRFEMEKKARQELAQAQENFAFGMIETLVQVAGQESVLGKALFAFQQAMYIADIWIQKAKSDAKIIAEANAMFAYLGPAGPPAAAAWTAPLIASNAKTAVWNTALIAGQTLANMVIPRGGKNKNSGYWTGGYTGDGNPAEVAGPVHRGEWVANSRLLQDANAAPVVAWLDQYQRSMPLPNLPKQGFASGGYTSAPQTPAPVQSDPEMKALIIENIRSNNALNETLKNPLTVDMMGKNGVAPGLGRLIKYYNSLNK